MSSSGSPKLYGKPIEKLKVTELREELKKRGTPTKGLKEELVRRLAATLQQEEEQANQANQAAEFTPVFPVQAAEFTPVVPVQAAWTTETTPVVAQIAQEPTEMANAITEASAELFTTPPPPPVFSKPEVDAVMNQDPKVDDVRDVDSSVVDVKDASVQKSEAEVDEKNEQVSSAETGIEVKKSDCISNDCVSNNEKIELELKDNEIAGDNHVKLDQNVSKSPSGGKSHPMDVEEPLEQEKTKENNLVVVDAGDSEKLNLDRSSSGDDESMEDEPETKLNESVTSDEVVNKNEKPDMVIDNKEETRADAAKEKAPVVDSEKRKLPTNDQEAVKNNEPVKRQRRWNSDSVKVPEVTNNVAAAVPTTITPRSTGLKRDFARSDSSVSEDGPKERVVPPSPKEPTNSLRIDRFLRPFTLKAVQELLGKTGNVTSFWMDHIKTHCYVSYGSVEEAAATREAVYNLQWPPNGGRLLTAEFVGEAEVKAKLEAPLPTPPPPPTTQAKPLLQQPHALPPPPPLVKQPPQVIERLPLPPPPPPPVIEEQEAPIVTLDDLFQKTKATPRIYYLPLSEEQVAAKLAANNNK